MGLLFRGIVWFGLYLALAGLPLFCALVTDPFTGRRSLLVEISAGAGLVAFSLLALQFALVGRIKSASAPFGTDALLQFHRQLGMAAIGFAVLHPLLLTGWRLGIESWNPLAGSGVSQSGAIAVWTAVVLLATSLFRRRFRLSYEAWNAVHLTGAVLLVLAMTVHVLLVSGYAGSAVMRGLLVAYAVMALALLLRYRLVRPALLARKPWEVVSNRDDGGSTRTIGVRPLNHAGLEFEPGQFAWLLTGGSPLWAQQHPLTISSSAELPADRSLEFSIKALGDWSGTAVPRLAPGDRVWVDGPYGVFTPEREPALGLFLIAGGIGVSPMRSMLLTMRDRDDRRPVVLLHAVHDPSRAIFAEELEALQRVLDLKVVYVYEAPGPDWQGERGYITRAMIECYLPRHYRHFQFFICGPVPMNDAVERMLLASGVRAERIHTERFNMV